MFRDVRQEGSSVPCQPSELALPGSGGEELGEGTAGLLEGLEGGARRRPIGALGDG